MDREDSVTCSATSTRLGFPGWLVLAALVAGGLWLRYADVREQMLGGDEYHAIRVARDHELAEIFTFYGGAENSIPLTLYTRAVMQTVGLNEFRFRLPALLSGLALLLAPLAFRRRLGGAATLVAMALIATSPMAIYYSFVGRPYGPAAALLVAALCSWWRWLGTSSAGWLALFVASAALAVFFHLLCLLPVGWLVGLAWLAARRGEDPGSRRVLIMTAMLLLAGLALFGPGLEGLIDKRLLNSKRPGAGTPLLAWVAFVRLTGEQPAAAVVLVTLAVLGSVRLIARQGLLGLALVGLLPALLVGMFITQPFPRIGSWTRYLFLAWLPFLLCSSVGAVTVLDALQRRLASRRALAGLAGAVGLGVLLVHAGGDDGAAALTRDWVPWLPALLLLVAAFAALVGSGRTSVGTSVGTSTDTSTDSGPIVCASVFALTLAAATVAWTPVALFQRAPDSLRLRTDSVRRVGDATRREWAAEVSPFFHELARSDDAGELLLVWPYRQHPVLWRPFVKQQIVHGQRLVAVQERSDDALTAVGIEFENIVDPKQVHELVHDGARYLVLYLPYVEGHDGGLAADLARYNPPVKASYFAVLVPTLERRHGPPIYRDDAVQVYDLWTNHPPSAR